MPTDGCGTGGAGVRGLAPTLRLLGDETRLAILLTVAGGERSVGDLWSTLGVPQPTVSQRLAGLRAAGLVARRHAGKNVFYDLGPGARAAGPDAVEVECPEFTVRVSLAKSPAAG